MRSKTQWIAAKITLFVVAVALSACHGADSVRTPGAVPANALAPSEVREIAREAYVYGVPMVNLWKGIHTYNIDAQGPEYRGPPNTVANFARVFTPADKAFVTPNSDTPYSFIALDLRAEPMVIEVPAMEPERYFVFQLMDLMTFNFAYIGTRATGNEGGKYLIVGPDWSGDKPDGIDGMFRSETTLVSVVGRTQLFDPADIDNIRAIQDRYKTYPLSTFLGTKAPPAAPAIDWMAPLPPGSERESLAFFELMTFLLQFGQPPHASEVDLRERFAQIGIDPEKGFDPDEPSPEARDAFRAGMKQGQGDIDALRAKLDGKTDALFGTRDFLGNDYVKRATGTQVGIGANSREEALYPMITHDASGQLLDGSKGRYTMRFPPDGLPPVKAFWSITLYDMPGQLLVDNPINRYLINTPMLPDMQRDADGGLTIRIQHEPPSNEHASNWLPAPDGPFILFMRYYWPDQALLDGQWQTPAVARIDP